MIAAVLVFGVGGLIASPHLIARRSLPAVVGTIIWFSALLGRAGVVVTICVGLVAIAPDTRVFAEASDWFVHSVLPFALHSLGIEGDTLGHLATSVPFATVLGMAIAAAYGSWRSHRLVGRWLDRACLGPGPSGCHIVGGSRVVFATAGVLRPRVIVSMGALMSLEDRELRAGIEHEQAQIAPVFFANTGLGNTEANAGDRQKVMGSGRSVVDRHFSAGKKRDEKGRKTALSVMNSTVFRVSRQTDLSGQLTTAMLVLLAGTAGTGFVTADFRPRLCWLARRTVA